jgi:serine/threonine protein kinase
LLGKGAFGAVYQGLDMKTGAMVAIKQVKLKGINDKELAAIMSEVNLLKRLDHTNIVKYLGIVRTPEHLNFILEYVFVLQDCVLQRQWFQFYGTLTLVVCAGDAVGGRGDCFVVRRFIEGGSLLSLVKKFGEVQEVLAVRYVAQTLAGLDYLHRRGVIHRDIKWYLHTER